MELSSKTEATHVLSWIDCGTEGSRKFDVTEWCDLIDLTLWKKANYNKKVLDEILATRLFY